MKLSKAGMTQLVLLIALLTSLSRMTSQVSAQSDASVAAVASILSYVRPSADSPSPSSVASASVLGEDDRPLCTFSQAFNMTGHWMPSPSTSFHGFYNMTADCPSYAQDFDCQTPQRFGINNIMPEFINTEYNQVFRADNCALRAIDPEHFNKEMKGRRLILLGDSLMRGNWQSLACLLRNVTVNGSSSTWTPENTNLAPGNYTVAWYDTTKNVTKQFVGEFTLKSGGKVIIRDHSQYQQQLFDDIMAEWRPLTSQDVLVISYGGWYTRFGYGSKQEDWYAFQDHVTHLFQDRLATWPGQVIWKSYTPQHFGGPFGIPDGISGLVGSWQIECQDANVGEFWYDDFVRGILNGTNADAYSHIRILPIYEMTRQRPYMHGGAFGRGVDDGAADCKHYCSGLLDWWNIVLYTMLFP